MSIGLAVIIVERTTLEMQVHNRHNIQKYDLVDVAFLMYNSRTHELFQVYHHLENHLEWVVRGWDLLDEVASNTWNLL